MARRPVVTIPLLVLALILTLPVRAQPKIVAPGLSPAPADVAASLPRHGGVKPPLQDVGPSSAGPGPNAVRPYVACADGPGPAPANPAKPFTREQASNMVRDGFGDESGAKLIEGSGIDFAPSADFIQTLKSAGASEAFLKALRAAVPSVEPGLSPAPADVAASLPRHGGIKPPLQEAERRSALQSAALKGGSTTVGPPASARKPINQVQVFALLASGVPGHRVTMLVQERGIDFEPTDDYLQEVRLAGGEDELISALKSAKVTKPATVDPTEQARQTNVRRHVARGAQFLQTKRYAYAEREYRAAVRLDPQNANLHTALGTAIEDDGNPDGAIVEDREALRLDPSNGNAHVGLGNALADKGDWDGAASEFRQALRRDPENEYWHCNLGAALREMGDLDGAIAEYREALRLNPNNGTAHTGIGIALERKGDLRGALGEYRMAYLLDPKDAFYKQNYERLLQQMNK